MADSDEDYVQDLSEEEAEADRVMRGTRTSAKAPGKGRKGIAGGGWEVTRTWENVVESADGTINSTVEELLEAGKRKRMLKDTTPLQRGIIRHLVIIIDLSIAMAEKDLRPTRCLLTLRYAAEFVTEFFEQNPISQLGIVGMRDGLAVRVSDMSGNPSDHITNLHALREKEPKGDASLQNALDMGRGALFHAPSHGTREILIIFGSLLSSDPGDIHSTISALVSSHITCTVIGLAAKVAVCSSLVSRTNSNLSPEKTYSVCLNEAHFRDLFMGATIPPATQTLSSSTRREEESGDAAVVPTLLMMGFPSRITDTFPTFCACHSRPTLGGYNCSRCSSKVCSLPTTCPVCELTLVLSTHLARSYHHLFPLQNWSEVPWDRAQSSEQTACFGCQTPFPDKPRANLKDTTAPRGKDGVSDSGRYVCGTCELHFCIDCDVFCHDIVHNCPGCQSRDGELAVKQASNEVVGRAS